MHITFYFNLEGIIIGDVHTDDAYHVGLEMFAPGTPTSKMRVLQIFIFLDE